MQTEVYFANRGSAGLSLPSLLPSTVTCCLLPWYSCDVCRHFTGFISIFFVDTYLLIKVAVCAQRVKIPRGLFKFGLGSFGPNATGVGDKS